MFVKSMFVVIRVRLMFTEPKMRMFNGRQITKQQINRKELCVMKKQIFAKMAAAVIILGTVAGCGQTQKGVSITIGNWPTKEQSGYDGRRKTAHRLGCAVYRNRFDFKSRILCRHFKKYKRNGYG